jgi:Sulfotransferase family
MSVAGGGTVERDREPDADRLSSTPPSPVIHIGFPKTGTTALQRGFFPRLEPFVYLNSRLREHDMRLRPLLNQLREVGDDEYPEAELSEFLTNAAGGGPFLISDEELSWPRRGSIDLATRTATRLHGLAPDARILICVRHQGSMIRSLYSLYVQKGGSETFARYLDRHQAILENLRYDRVVELYGAVFGGDRVKVMPYESLLTDPEGFLGELARFLSAEVRVDQAGLAVANRSLSRPSRWLLRHYNRLFRVSPFNPRPLLVAIPEANRFRRLLHLRIDPWLFSRAPRGLPRSDQKRLDSLLPTFAQSNLRLSRLTGLSLRELGYPMGPEQS